MSITADYHLHTNFSTDSDEPMENMVKKAIELGLTEICFTEHHDPNFPFDEHNKEGSFILNTDAYLYDLLKFREKYKDQINILFGVELGMQSHLRRDLAVYAKSYDFDFIIASVHVLDGKDPYFRDDFKELTDEELYRKYFTEVLNCLKIFSNFDVLGHLDYIVRYGYQKDKDYSYDKYKDCIDPILEKIIDMEKAIEVNTGSLAKSMSNPNPCADIIKRYRELGGEIVTIGSDSHSSSNIAYGFDKVSELLKDCGFKYYATYEKRYAQMHRL